MTFADPAVIRELVGVVDLRDGVPVHAVAGERRRYRPVVLPGRYEPALATELIEFYRLLGINRIYVADLNGLMDGNPQWSQLRRVLDSCSQFAERFVDFGWRGNETATARRQVSSLVSKDHAIRLVAASESALHRDAPNRLEDLIGADRVTVGLDYHNATWRGPASAESEWWSQARKLKSAILLDIGTVGTEKGPVTESLVRSLKRCSADLSVYSGGGVRHAADVWRLKNAGCSGCLVATAIHRLNLPETFPRA